MFRFEENIWLYALLLIVPVLLLVFYYFYWKKKSIKLLADAHLLENLMPLWSPVRTLVKYFLWLAGFAFLVLAIANPQFGSRMEEVKRQGTEIIICLDVSNSMLAQDFSPNRLAAAKRSIAQMINRLKDDRIGLIVFAGESYVQLPLTSDYATAKLFLENIETEMIGTQGTAIGAAIELAMSSFDAKSKAGKSIIVISDGENHEDNPQEMASEALSKGILVHCIGLGSEEGVPIPIIVNGTMMGYRTDKEGNNVVTKLNVDLLQEVAAAGKGVFVKASSSQIGLDRVIDQLENMQKADLGTKKFTDYESRFQYFLVASFLCFVLERLISEKQSDWWRKLTQSNY
jgi:Ca-activated chloride channel family protein